MSKMIRYTKNIYNYKTDMSKMIRYDEIYKNIDLSTKEIFQKNNYIRKKID